MSVFSSHEYTSGTPLLVYLSRVITNSCLQVFLSLMSSLQNGRIMLTSGTSMFLSLAL